jgi:hypothetical protein
MTFGNGRDEFFPEISDGALHLTMKKSRRQKRLSNIYHEKFLKGVQGETFFKKFPPGSFTDPEARTV